MSSTNSPKAKRGLPLEGVEHGAGDISEFASLFRATRSPYRLLRGRHGSALAHARAARRRPCICFHRTGAAFSSKPCVRQTIPCRSSCMGFHCAAGSVLVVGSPQEAGDGIGVDALRPRKRSRRRRRIHLRAQRRRRVERRDVHQAPQHARIPGVLALRSHSRGTGCSLARRARFNRGRATLRSSRKRLEARRNPAHRTSREASFSFGLSLAYADGVLVVGAPKTTALRGRRR